MVLHMLPRHAVALAAGTVALATAVPAMGAVLPTNGRWAGQIDRVMYDQTGLSTPNAPQDVLLTIRNRRVSKARFNFSLDCQDDQGQYYNAYFDGGNHFPSSARFNARNVLTARFAETDALSGRRGAVVAKVDFSGAVPKFRVNVEPTAGEPGARCGGTIVIPIRAFGPRR